MPDPLSTSKMKKFTFEIEKKSKEINYITLLESHSEFIRFHSWGGSGLFSEFEFSLSQANSKHFTVQISCKEGEKEMIEKGLRNCIDKLTELYEQKGLTLKPFHISLKNYRIHQIDTKPVCFNDPIRKRICELIDEETKFQIDIQTNHNNSNTNFSTYEENAYHRHTELATMTKLPWLNQQALVLKDNWRFKIEVGGLDWYSSTATFQVDIQNHFRPNSINYIAAEIDEETPNFIAISINSELQNFKNLIYSRNLNLGGFKIKFKETSKWSAKYAEERVFNTLRIRLRELINSETNYEIKETKPVDNKR